MDKKRNLPLIVLCYAGLYLIWGSTYFFIGKAVETISPGVLMAGRFITSGIVFILFPIISGQVKKLPTLKQLGSALFLGFFLLVMGNGVVSIAQQWVDSYIASLMVSTVPLAMTIFSLVIFRKRPNWKQIVGFFIGFAGVGFLLYSDTPPEGAKLQGILIIFLAVLCWSFASVWSKKLDHYPQTFFSTGIQMLFAGSLALIVVLVRGEDLSLLVTETSPISLKFNSSS